MGREEDAKTTLRLGAVFLKTAPKRNSPACCTCWPFAWDVTLPVSATKEPAAPTSRTISVLSLERPELDGS
ncbi:hypothetical protein EFA69_13415 [Rufibacter immobilis]|uniref:Uncharacterized protein n=1 Tax=Rufibacter immobilis TaxID=1348778 RepID=A0A3M9MNP6_9BACT|nr:hypothetical protein EFA69_13415 [Rufibacter immobilis]